MVGNYPQIVPLSIARYCRYDRVRKSSDTCPCRKTIWIGFDEENEHRSMKGWSGIGGTKTQVPSPARTGVRFNRLILRPKMRPRLLQVLKLRPKLLPNHRPSQLLILLNRTPGICIRKRVKRAPCQIEKLFG